MEFSCLTVYDYPAIKTLQYAVMYKNRNPILLVLLRTFLCAALTVLFGGAVLFLLCTGAADQIRPIWVVLTFLFLALIALTLYCHFGLPKAAYRANSRNGETKVVYTFRDDSFTVDAAANGVSSSTNVMYTSLFAAYQTGTHYLLFMAKNNANLVSRAALSPEQDQWLAETLRGTLGRAYRICKF